MNDTASMLLLQLPDSFLLAVLKCCADAHDTTTLFNAAQAHSKLHQAAVMALTSISAVANQQQVDSLSLYLSKHGQRVGSIDLVGADPETSLRQLPEELQLHTLQLYDLRIQLRPSYGHHGVLRLRVPLKKLRLSDCTLLDGAGGLAAALLLLPSLEHLSVRRVSFRPYGELLTNVLEELQQLTCLELAGISMRAAGEQPSAALQPLQALNRLVELEIGTYMYTFDLGLHPYHINASMLSGASCLTRLAVSGQQFEPGVLGGKTQLQHLALPECALAPYTSAGTSQLLLQLQDLQQLTHLNLESSCQWTKTPDSQAGPPPASFAALTASSKLQHLNFSKNNLPPAAWQHMFPTGRQLPRLLSLDVNHVRGPTANAAWAADPDSSSRIVCCCPSLQSFKGRYRQASAELLGQLQTLSSLHTLHVGSGLNDHVEGLDILRQLTGLRELHLSACSSAEGLVLLRLTELKQLTSFVYCGFEAYSLLTEFKAVAGRPGDRPMGQQLLTHLKHTYPDPVARQAAEALLMSAAEAGL